MHQYCFGQKYIKELQKTSSEYAGLVEQYFKQISIYIYKSIPISISINKSNQNTLQSLPNKEIQKKRDLKILVKKSPLVNVKSNNFLGVIIDTNLSRQVHTDRICSRISHSLFIINRLYMKARRML
jgi:hypothetical protein